MTMLSKALSAHHSFGAYCCASRILIIYINTHHEQLLNYRSVLPGFRANELDLGYQVVHKTSARGFKIKFDRLSTRQTIGAVRDTDRAGRKVKRMNEIESRKSKSLVHWELAGPMNVHRDAGGLDGGQFPVSRRPGGEASPALEMGIIHQPGPRIVGHWLRTNRHFRNIRTRGEPIHLIRL